MPARDALYARPYFADWSKTIKSADITGIFAACVQNGLGTARGTLTGIAAAEMAIGQTSDITRSFSNEAAPKRLPPQPFRDIGANAVLRWKERQAAQE